MNLNIKRMPEAARPNRPVDRTMSDENEQEFTPTRPQKSSKGPWVLVLTIVVILVVLGVVFQDKLFTNGKIATSKYQAVFLSNGQVYFGDLTNPEKGYAHMENIYYLQVTPVLQTQGTGEPGAQAANQQQQQLSLVKLGNELHGPVDEMYINRDHILFIEDLKEDGRVVQAIKDYEEGQAGEGEPIQ